MGSTTDGAENRPGRAGARQAAGRRLLFGTAVALAAVSATAAVSTASTGTPGLQDAAAAEAPAAAPVTPAFGLSAGAPAGAVILAEAPTAAAVAAPADDATVTGLAANGIPNVALNAYRVAAARMGSALPGCRIDWSLLAGIGRVESNHGRFAGALLNADGTSTPPIVGPALDGVGFAFVRDTDGGRWDGDGGHDRAVGPMQFIPSTWRSYAVDGDGSGTADPFDIDDESVAAAHYLCVAGGDLSSDAGQRRAVLAYNHSDSYVAQVLALARSYAAGIPVADLPLVGDTTSPVPAPTGDYRAPAAPGPAIGAGDRTPSAPGQATAVPGAAPDPQAAPAPAAEEAPAGGGGTTSGQPDPDPGGEAPVPSAPEAGQPVPADEQPVLSSVPLPAPPAPDASPLPLPTAPAVPLPPLPSLPVPVSPLPGLGG